jgi:SPP1 gp7 family putative phage head morphogenesis protein
MTKFDRSIAAVAEADKALATLDAAQTKSIHNAISNSIQTLNRNLRSKWGDRAGADLFSRDRAILLANDLRDTLNILAPSSPATVALLKELENTLKTAGDIGNKFAQESAVGQLSAASSANIAVDVAASAARQAHDMLLSHGTQFASNASVAIQQGILLGYGVQKTASMITSLGEVTKARAATIVRTETMRASVDATKRRFAADGIDQVIWIATQDRRTCPRCASRAGKIMPADQAIIPLHPNDRCTVIAYKKEWDEAGLIDHEWLNSHHSDVNKRAGIESELRSKQAVSDPSVKAAKAEAKARPEVTGNQFESENISGANLRKIWKKDIDQFKYRLLNEKADRGVISDGDYDYDKLQSMRLNRTKLPVAGQTKATLEQLGDNIWIAEEILSSRDQKIIVKSNKVVAAAATYTDRGNSLEVEYLATSPRNFYKDAGGVKGAGTEAIRAVVRESINKGYNGTVTLTALEGAESFYEKIGFVEQPGNENRKLKSYILSPEAAKRLINE